MKTKNVLVLIASLMISANALADGCEENFNPDESQSMKGPQANHSEALEAFLKQFNLNKAKVVIFDEFDRSSSEHEPRIIDIVDQIPAETEKNVEERRANFFGLIMSIPRGVSKDLAPEILRLSKDLGPIAADKIERNEYPHFITLEKAASEIKETPNLIWTIYIDEKIPSKLQPIFIHSLIWSLPRNVEIRTASFENFYLSGGVPAERSLKFIPARLEDLFIPVFSRISE
jgi:hypothetical protein